MLPGALPLIILKMWSSINCSLAPTWYLRGAFNINLINLFWVHCILHFNFFDNPLYSTKLSRCNQNDIESKQISKGFFRLNLPAFRYRKCADVTDFLDVPAGSSIFMKR